MNKTLKESVAGEIEYHVEDIENGYDCAAEHAIREVGEHLLAAILMQFADGKPIAIDRLIKEECGL